MKATIIKTEGIVQGTDFMRYGKNRAYFKVKKAGNNNTRAAFAAINESKPLVVKLHGGVFESNYDTHVGTETEITIGTTSGLTNFISPDTEIIEIDNIKNIKILNIKNTYGEGLVGDDENSVLQLYACKNITALEGIVISGDITDILKNNQNLSIITDVVNCYGDLSYIGNSITNLYFNSSNKFTWTGNKNCTSTFNCNSVYFADSASIDLFLKDMAGLTVRGTTIKIWGTRTSASDTAVQTLVDKGISLFINGTQITNE